MLRRQGTRLACTKSPEKMSMQLTIAEEPALKKRRISDSLLPSFGTVLVHKHEKSPNPEDRVTVKKIDLAEKKSPKSENLFFRLPNRQSTQKKLLDTLRVALSRTRDPVFFF